MSQTIGSIHEDCSGFDFQPLTEAEQTKVKNQQVINEETKNQSNNSENK